MISLKNAALVSSIAAVLAGGFAGAASAQPGRHADRGAYDHRVDRGGRLSTAYVDGLDWKITNAAREGRISWREARTLHAELAQVKPIAWRYQTGQARPGEVQRLSSTVDRITFATRG